MSFSRSFIVVVLLSSLTSIASGQSMPENVRKHLGKLVGVWKLETTVDGKPVTEVVSVKWSDDKNTIHYEGKGTNFETGESVTFSGILGWDGSKKTVVEQNFDSLGGNMTATHNIDGEKWRSRTRANRIDDGKTRREQHLRIFKWKDGDNWTVVSTNRTVNGEAEEDRTTTFTRQTK